MVIVGGCFPVQHNIPADKLYHFLIKKEADPLFNCNLNFNIIRYDRFSDCLNKIRSGIADRKADILLFHFRSEHFQRLTKFYYKYHDDNGKVRRSINLLMFNISKAEVPDLLSRVNPVTISHNQLSSVVHRILVTLNYLLGSIVGNVHYALKRYENLAGQVMEYCKANDIQLILAGPVSRTHTKYENYLAQRISRHMKNKYDCPGNIYTDLLGEKTGDGDSLFFNDGAHVNETGHRRIANLILKCMDNILQN